MRTWRGWCKNSSRRSNSIFVSSTGRAPRWTSRVWGLSDRSSKRSTVPSPSHEVVTAQQRAQPRQEFGEVEGLDEVVIGPDVEALDAVVDGVTRGEHQDRRRVARAPDAPTDLEPVDVGELQVEHDGVGRAQLDRVEAR